MEYDPASPTDDHDDNSGNHGISIDISTIPLPEFLVCQNTSELDIIKLNAIPLPPQSDLSMIEIPLPPTDDSKSRVQLKQEDQSVFISTKISPNFFNQENFKVENSDEHSVLVKNENSSFGSAENQTKDSNVTSRFQSITKRSRPGLLKVGVLPQKNKGIELESKTELFKPTKKDEAEIIAEFGSEIFGVQAKLQPALSALSANLTAQLNFSSKGKSKLPGSTLSLDSLTSVLRESKVLSGLTTVNQINALMCSISSSEELKNVILNLQNTDCKDGSFSSGLDNTGFIKDASDGLSLDQKYLDIGNLNTIALSNVDTSQSIFSMQYMNPQKMRSAQMIATPLIANPALANQSKLPPKNAMKRSKGRTRRSRSRSRSRSDSHKRNIFDKREKVIHSESIVNNTSTSPQRQIEKKHSNQIDYEKKIHSRDRDLHNFGSSRRRDDKFEIDHNLSKKIKQDQGVVENRNVCKDKESQRDEKRYSKREGVSDICTDKRSKDEKVKLEVMTHRHSRKSHSPPNNPQSFSTQPKHYTLREQHIDKNEEKLKHYDKLSESDKNYNKVKHDQGSTYKNEALSDHKKRRRDSESKEAETHGSHHKSKHDVAPVGKTASVKTETSKCR